MRPRLASAERRFRKSRRPRRMQWQQHLVYHRQYGTSQGQMPSKSQDRGSQRTKAIGRVDFMLRKRTKTRQPADDDQKDEMRGEGGKDATASIATGIATAAEAAAGIDIGIIGREIGMAMAMVKGPHAATVTVTVTVTSSTGP
jgi:hypothetical protein